MGWQWPFLAFIGLAAGFVLLLARCWPKKYKNSKTRNAVNGKYNGHAQRNGIGRP